VVSVVLDETLRNAQDELKKLLQDKARPPSTYNHYYSDTIQKLRHDKYKAMLAKAKAAANLKVFGGANNANMNMQEFQQEIEKAVERDTETYGAKEALDCQNAIYKVCIASSISPRRTMTLMWHTGQDEVLRRRRH
jgi:hypothetical protein